MTARYGVQHNGSWMHCPISGTRITGTRAQMRQYAKDMTYLGFFIRPNGEPSTGFACRRLPPMEGTPVLGTAIAALLLLVAAAGTLLAACDLPKAEPVEQHARAMPTSDKPTSEPAAMAEGTCGGGAADPCNIKFRCDTEARQWSEFAKFDHGFKDSADRLLIEWRKRGGSCPSAAQAKDEHPGSRSSSDFVACGLSLRKCDEYCHSIDGIVGQWDRIWRAPTGVVDPCDDVTSRCACELPVFLPDGGAAP